MGLKALDVAPKKRQAHEGHTADLRSAGAAKTSERGSLAGRMRRVVLRNGRRAGDTASQRRFNEKHQHGYLTVGHAESLIGLISDFKAVLRSVYIKSGLLVRSVGKLVCEAAV